jgi:hypothetical protein
MDIAIARLKAFPELARLLLSEHLELLQQLPAPFASFLVREVVQYDWKFPVEREEIASNFKFLSTLSSSDFESLMRPFRSIKLPAPLANEDWIVDPIAYSEKLTAHLWATHQIDGFRSAAVVYMDNKTAALPPAAPTTPRAVFIMVGDGAKEPEQRLFNKLRPHGTHYTHLDGKTAFPVLLSTVADRAKALPVAFAHWYIDGGIPAKAAPGVTTLSYGGLGAARAVLQKELKTSYEKKSGSEAMRSQLAQKKPEDLGLQGKGDAAVLDRFAMTLLTEGSGTQIYSTTFVQWAAREALRRAQPLTMLVRFRPRQRERPMQELLLEAQRTPDLDPEGSLVDAEMGAYYTWLNAQRLPGAEQSSFVAVFENGKQAIAIGPSMKKGATDQAYVGVQDVLSRMLSA